MIARFGKTRNLKVQPGRKRKPTRSDIVEDIATAIVEQSIYNVTGCSARAVSRNFSVPYSTMQNILRKLVHFLPTQNSLQLVVVASRQGEAIDLCIDISG